MWCMSNIYIIIIYVLINLILKQTKKVDACKVCIAVPHTQKKCTYAFLIRFVQGPNREYLFLSSHFPTHI